MSPLIELVPFMTGPKAEACRGHAKSGQTRKPTAMVSMPCERECWSAATVIVEVAASMPSCHRDGRALPTVGTLTPCRSRCLLRAPCCPVTFAGWSRACRLRSERKGTHARQGIGNEACRFARRANEAASSWPILVQARPPHAQAAAFLPPPRTRSTADHVAGAAVGDARLAGGGRQSSFAGSPRGRGREHRNGVPQCIV